LVAWALSRGLLRSSSLVRFARSSPAVSIGLYARSSMLRWADWEAGADCYRMPAAVQKTVSDFT